MDNSGFVKTMLLKPSHEHIKNLNVLVEKEQPVLIFRAVGNVGQTWGGGQGAPYFDKPEGTDCPPNYYSPPRPPIRPEFSYLPTSLHNFVNSPVLDQAGSWYFEKL